ARQVVSEHVRAVPEADGGAEHGGEGQAGEGEGACEGGIGELGERPEAPSAYPAGCTNTCV
ncbi:MAG: hypothetical protein VXV97_14300, partial [Pseudomonadota bacterium]|nr:hypothetical protein [Pseudomonadota bacterium]